MSNNITVARPYAKAAFARALQTHTLNKWLKLLQVAAAVVHDARVAVFLQNPRFSQDEHLQCLLNACGDLLLEEGRNFFALLALRRRLNRLPEIVELFHAYCIEHEKTAQVQIISASPLSEAEKQRLIQALKGRLKREITLECQIDDTLLGGLIIKTGDWVMDDSIRSKLMRLSTALVN
jgi:F-type H+-transporting ATPase subunit delta